MSLMLSSGKPRTLPSTIGGARSRPVLDVDAEHRLPSRAVGDLKTRLGSLDARDDHEQAAVDRGRLRRRQRHREAEGSALRGRHVGG